MGLAIIIPGADYSTHNIGVVAPFVDVPVNGLSISGPSAVVGISQQYDAVFTPSNTTERGVVWSVESGSSYATIDNNGNLSVLPGASENVVVIRATSSENQSIYSELEVTVTYNVHRTVDFGSISWQYGERMQNGTISQRTNVWGTTVDSFDVSGISTLTPNIPSGVGALIIELMYFTNADVFVAGPKYLYPNGPWSGVQITPDFNVPEGADKVYINCAINLIGYDPSNWSGVSVDFDE